MLWLWEREFSLSLSPSLPPSDDDGPCRTFIALLTMYFPASYMEDYAVLHDVDPHLAFYAVRLSRPLSIFITDPFLTVGNHAYLQPDGAHSDGSSRGQAWIFHLVDPHHSSIGCELVCHRFSVRLPFFFFLPFPIAHLLAFLPPVKA